MLTFQILSHKILRWLVGFFFLSMLTAAIALYRQPLYAFAAGGSTVVVALALIGFRYPDIKKTFITIPYYFTLVNLAALLGFVDFVRGKRIVTWKPVR